MQVMRFGRLDGPRKRLKRPSHRRMSGLLNTEARAVGAPAGSDAKTNVYIIGAVGHPVKVGIAEAPKSRLSELQVGNPASLRIYVTREVLLSEARSIERECHQRMSCHHLRGEWFDRTPEEAEAVLDLVLRLRSEAMPGTTPCPPPP